MFETLLETLRQTMKETLLPAVLILVSGVLVIRILVKLTRTTLEKTKLEKAAHSLILSVLRVTLYILLALMIATRLGIDVTSIVALASVLTLSVSLAVQNILANVIGGFTILTTQPFHSGDYVEIAGQAGTVQEINMTYTRLATYDNKLISIPNSSVIAAQIINYTATDSRRLTFDVTVPHAEPAQKVMDALVLAGTEGRVLLDPAPYAVITGYSERGVHYSLRVWSKNADYWDVFFAVNERIKKIFEEQAIPMSYPNLNVHLDR